MSKLPRNEIICADVLEGLRGLPEGSVHCVVTSPPYWSLRSYAGEQERVWGGDQEGCEHEWGERYEQHDVREETVHGKTRTTDRFYGDESRRFDGNHQKHAAGQVCVKCGAFFGALGLEPLHDCGRHSGELCAGCYVCHMVVIFREVRRVLRDDGCAFVNLGDSYASAYACDRRNVVGAGSPGPECERPNRLTGGLKPKDLVMMPFRVALALQADGWYVRQDIIWSKKNPMPESVTDRPTTSHEHVFLLAKSARYAYDGDAIRERYNEKSIGRYESPKQHTGQHIGGRQPGGEHGTEQGEYGPNPLGRNKRSVWQVELEPDDEDYCPCCGSPVTGEVWHIATDQSNYEFCNACGRLYVGGERKHIKQYEIDGKKVRECSCGETESWVGHFATMPRGLVRPCVRAGSSEAGCCAECGAPRERVVEKNGGAGPAGIMGVGKGRHIDDFDQNATGSHVEPPSVTTLGFSPTCDCATEDTQPCVVLDPFGGSGTTGIVAVEEGRDYVLIDLSDEYCELARERIARVSAQPRLDF